MIRLIFISLLMGIFLNTHAQNNITFRINLKEQIAKDVYSLNAGDIVIVRGSFDGGASNDYKMKDDDSDSIFTGTFNIVGELDSIIDYKFVIIKSNSRIIWESNPDSDNPPYGNRKLILKGKPQLLTTTNFHLENFIGQNAEGKISFSIEQLQNDFVELRNSLEEIHCCLYEYTNREEFDSLFKHQYELINNPMEYQEFYNIVSPLVVKAGCMHTGIWMPDEFWELSPNKLFPLQLKLIEGHVVVSGYYNDAARVPIGSIILKINSRPINEIINTVKNSYSSDAMNENFQLAGFEKRFPLRYASIYGYPENYVVTYSLPGGKTLKTTILIPANIQSVRDIVFNNFDFPPLTLNVLEGENTAVLKIPSFSFYDRVDFFTSFLDSSFNVIKKKNINNLVLDLRGNDGGDPFC